MAPNHTLSSGHIGDMFQTRHIPQKHENPANAGLCQWAVEDSNLQPWD
jgi:hypothetical protein